jgi:hypothetical protein
MSYQCEFCEHIYRQKFNYDRHVVCCEFLHKSQKERDYETDMEQDKIPSQREMYQIMQTMSLKIQKLEAEVKKMKQIQNKKMDLVEWLNNQGKQPDQVFYHWLRTKVYSKIKDVLEVVYTTDLLKGCKDLFKLIISESKQEELPIRAFENKENCIYIYVEKSDTLRKECHWIKISNTEFDKILGKIDEQFILNFRVHWYEPNKDKMDKEVYKDMYVRNYAKVLGTERMSDTARHNQIRQYLYDILKQPIKAFVEV